MKLIVHVTYAVTLYVLQKSNKYKWDMIVPKTNLFLCVTTAYFDDTENYVT